MNTTPKKNAPKLALYVRVSTISQNYASQLHALEAFCRRYGWKIPGKSLIFAEKFTGKKARRTKLDAMLTACRDGLVDTVLTYRLDRLGNSAQHLFNLLAEFDRIKIRVVGVSDGVDTELDNATTRKQRGELAVAAQYNREIISERTREGLAAARKRGRIGGKPRQNDSAIGEALRICALGKLSLSAIARRVGLSASYLSRLKNGKRRAP